MAYEVLMPKLSSTMDMGTITYWLKNEGDSVEVGEGIFEVMTDKIAIEVESYEEGILLKKYIGDGESAPVNSVIAYIGVAGEEVPDTPPTTEQDMIEQDDSTATVAPEIVSAEKSDGSGELKTTGIRATPAARRLAREKNISLSDITGSGPKGRIQATDVQNVQSKQSIAEAATTSIETSEVIPWDGMRKVIAERMSASKITIPHVTMNGAVDMRAVIDLRKEVLPMIEKQSGERISFTEIIMKATMVALKEFPIFNSHALEDGIHQMSAINMGLAVAVADGLVVPVIKAADQMGLTQLTRSTKELTAKAREGRLSGADMQGGTFTISSLGQSKVQTFNPIINAPEVAILGVGGMTDTLKLATVAGEATVIECPIVNLSLSFDHRVVDGAPAAEFLSRIIELLENPLGLLL